MTETARRKGELLVACQLQREILRVEWAMVRVHVSRMQDRAHQWSRTWRWLAPLAGVLVARRLRRPAGKASLGGRSIKWLLGCKLLDHWIHRRRRNRDA